MLRLQLNSQSKSINQCRLHEQFVEIWAECQHGMVDKIKLIEQCQKAWKGVSLQTILTFYSLLICLFKCHDLKSSAVADVNAHDELLLKTTF